MKDPRRDFNLAAKIILGLSIVSLATGIVSSFLFGARSIIHIDILCNVILIITAISIYFKKKYGLIAFIILGIFRIFITVPTETNLPYAYYLGRNTISFLKEIGLFAIAMCFRKNGLSGWTALCADDDVIDYEYQPPRKKVMGIITPEEETIKASPAPSSQNEPNYSSSIKENPIGREKGSQTNNKDAVHSKPKHYKGNVLKKLLIFGFPSIIILGIIVLGIIISSGSGYNRNSITFVDKYKEFFDLPNNNLAFALYNKAQEEYDKHLYEKAFNTAEDSFYYYPIEPTIVKELCLLYYHLSFRVEQVSLCQDRAITLAKRYRLHSTKDFQVNNALAIMVFNRDGLKEAVEIAQDILSQDENEIAYILMGRWYLEKSKWNDMLYWSNNGASAYPNSAELHYLKAKALKELGNNNGAYEEFCIGKGISTNHFLYKELSSLKPIQ